jgi:hypothetical protein
MLKKSLYTKPFDTWFPPTGVGYDVVFPLDLSTYHKNMHEITNMSVRLVYTVAAQTRWSLRSIAVVQRVYSWDEKNKWAWRDKI